MSNRKFRIIMQTVCIFRVIVVYFRAQDKRIPRRQLPQPPYSLVLVLVSVVMVARAAPRPAPFICRSLLPLHLPPPLGLY